MERQADARFQQLLRRLDVVAGVGVEVLAPALTDARLRGLRCFVVPQVTLRLLERVSPERAWEFKAAGAGLLAISTLCWYLVFTR